MNLKQLRLVREIIRANFSVTEAAAALYTSQSGVSKHIKDLEDELGIILFERRGKRLLGLTEPGREAVKAVDRLLLEADNIKQIAGRFSQSDKGTLTVATTHTQARYVLPPVIVAFRKAFPDVDLVLQQGSPRDLASLLSDGSAEIGIATDTLEGVTDRLAFPYYSWKHIVIVPPSHPLLKVKPPTLAAIAEHPIVTYDRGLTGRPQIDGAFAEAGLELKVTMAALDSDVIKTYVALGLGVGIVAQMAFDPARDKDLRRLPGPDLFPPTTTSIAVRRGRVLRGYAYRFIELAAPRITEDVIRIAQDGAAGDDDDPL